MAAFSAAFDVGALRTVGVKVGRAGAALVHVRGTW